MFEPKICGWCRASFAKPWKISRRQWAGRRFCSYRCAQANHGGGETPSQRFWSKVRKSDGCWEWTAYRTRQGYGTFNVTTAKPISAHRFAYLEMVGPIPDELDHLCRNPGCVRPSHLEPVSHAENMRRTLPFRTYTRQSHCKRGHPLVGTNIYEWHGKRTCRTCMHQRTHEWNAAHSRIS